MPDLPLRRLSVVGTDPVALTLACRAALNGRDVQILEMPVLALPLGSVSAPATLASTVSGFLDEQVSSQRITTSQSSAARSLIRLHASVDAFEPADLLLVSPDAIAGRGDALRALAKGARMTVGLNAQQGLRALAAEGLAPQRLASLTLTADSQGVEVVTGRDSDGEIGPALVSLLMRLGLTPIRVADVRGGIHGRLQAALQSELLQILEEGVCDWFTLHTILHDGIGFPDPPVPGLSDPDAVDRLKHLFMLRACEARLRPPGGGTRFVPVRPRDAGTDRPDPSLLDGLPVTAPNSVYLETAALEDEEALRFESSPQVLAALGRGVDRIRRDLEAAGVSIVADPRQADVLIVFPLGNDCTTEAVMGMQMRRQGDDVFVNPIDTVAIDLCPDIRGQSMVERVVTVMANGTTTPLAAKAVVAALNRPERPAVLIEDSPGFVAQRVIAHLVNAACDLAQDRTALPGDIDTLSRLNMGLARGPLAWGDSMGRGLIMGVLENLGTITGDPRYSPSLWLQRRAMLGLSLIHSVQALR